MKQSYFHDFPQPHYQGGLDEKKVQFIKDELCDIENVCDFSFVVSDELIVLYYMY